MDLNLDWVLLARDNSTSNSTTGGNEPEVDFYGYIPNRSLTVAFMTLFALSSVIHAFQAGRYRTWYAFPTIVLCGALEIIGWGGRLFSSFEPHKQTPFVVQAVGTLVGPTPLLAADFIILANLIRILGPKYSRLSPRLYSVIFLTCDIIAVATQGVGGALASLSIHDRKVLDMGNRIALYGVVFQFVVLNVYIYLALEFLIFYTRDRPFRKENPARTDLYIRGVMSNRRLCMVIVLVFNVACIYVRSIYRVAELAEGFGGEIIKTQTFFTVFDGEMILLAMWALNFGHSGRLLGEDIEPEVEKPWQLGEPLNGFRRIPNHDIEAS